MKYRAARFNPYPPSCFFEAISLPFSSAIYLPLGFGATYREKTSSKNEEEVRPRFREEKRRKGEWFGSILSRVPCGFPHFDL